MIAVGNGEVIGHVIAEQDQRPDVRERMVAARIEEIRVQKVLITEMPNEPFNFFRAKVSIP